MKSFRHTIILQAAIFFLLVLTLLKCKDPELTTTTTSDTNITGYIRKNPDEFSSFNKILELTKYGGVLNAYGTYTCFAPTNAAIDIYLNDKGKGSLEEFDIQELKDLVKFHIIKDTLSTSKFVDGKLSKPNMFGQYLTSDVVNEDGTSYKRINRQANIIKSDIQLGNGILHGINRVLEPAVLTIAQLVEQNPDYSIFTQALKETGFYDTLNILPANAKDSLHSWFTLIAQRDQVFANSGINSYEDLKNKYSKLGDPKNPKDSLYLFVAYHILPDIKYLTDLTTQPAHTTLASSEVVTTYYENETVVLNADVVNGVKEPGIALDRLLSDFNASNGVIHNSTKNYTCKVRSPFPLYWDVADQPELRLMTADFRKPDRKVTITPGVIKDIIWEGENPINYYCIGSTSADKYVYGDKLEIFMKSSTDGGGIPWIEFTTPVIVKGKYKIWVCYRGQSYNEMRTYFDGQPLPTQLGGNPRVYYPYSAADNVADANAEAKGFKRFTVQKDENYLARLMGEVVVDKTGRHKFKIEALSNRGGSTGSILWLDMVHIIPIDKPQIWPRFDKAGAPKYSY